MVSLTNPFGLRKVIERNGCVQVTLPGTDLDQHDIQHGDVLPGEYDDAAGALAVALDPHSSEGDVTDAPLALPVVVVGGSLGVTIPAPLRKQHSIAPEDALPLRPRDDGCLGWEIVLEEQRQAKQRARA